MKKFDIEYATEDIEDRHHVTYYGWSKTDVYLAFVKDYPKEYIIIEMTEVE